MSSPPAQLSARLQLKYPLIVAPMAGGPTTPELVIAACESGALGSIGAAYSSPEAILAFVDKVRGKTPNSFAINLFAPKPPPIVTKEQLELALRKLRPFREELGLPEPKLESPYEEDFDRQFEASLRAKPAVISFVFGVLPESHLNAARKEKIYTIGTATTFSEALELEDSGVDAITLQGFEAGGHRGLFDPAADDSNQPLMSLLADCRTKIRVPLIAAGGLMTAEHIRAAFAQGAQAAQLGTAFLACREAGTSPPYLAMLHATKIRTTRLTRAFSGRLARGIENRFMNEVDLKPAAIMPFPAQNKFTRDLRAASAKEGRSDFLSLWCGTGAGALWQGSAQGLIEKLFKI
jgi:nitronate monooxygenase